MPDGFVYVMSNPGLTSFKVGMSTRPLYLRRDELAHEYGTVHPFEIASRHAVADPAAVEALAHRILARDRVPRSELFACSQAECVRAIKAAAILVLERPWRVRMWHSLVLPHPAPPWRRRYYRGRPGGSLLVLLILAAVGVLVVQLKPELPPWLPAALVRTGYLLERLHR